MVRRTGGLTATDGFDHDATGGAVTEGDAQAVDLANERARTADLRNERGFAEAHLSHSLAKVGIAVELANSPQRACRQLAERE